MGKNRWKSIAFAIFVAASSSYLAPAAASAQTGEPGSVFVIGSQLSKKLDVRSGPALGAVGGALQLLSNPGEGNWGWGANLSLFRVGTVEQGNALATSERAINVGVRRVRGSMLQGFHAKLGADLVFLQNSGRGSTTTDPGIGLEIAAGWAFSSSPTTSILIESGVTGELVSGEYTAGGGAYVWFRVGLVAG